MVQNRHLAHVNGSRIARVPFVLAVHVLTSWPQGPLGMTWDTRTPCLSKVKSVVFLQAKNGLFWPEVSVLNSEVEPGQELPILRTLVRLFSVLPVLSVPRRLL